MSEKSCDHRMILVKEQTDTELKGECISSTDSNHYVVVRREDYLKGMSTVNGFPIYYKPRTEPRSDIDANDYWGG